MIALPVERHPCYSESAKGQWGRIHLAVAPKCNIQCRYCSRKTDCPNESRPGVSSSVLKPTEAVAYLGEVLRREPRIAVVGIAGPGDPLANREETFATLRAVRDVAPEMLLCLSTNGLGLDEEAVDVIWETSVSHVTITINAVDPKVGAKLYAWIRDGKKTYRGEEGAERLMQRQLDGIVMLKGRGIEVKVNTVVVPGVNDHHIGDIARVVSKLGANVHNLIPMMPAPGAEFESYPEPTHAQIEYARNVSKEYLPQMAHCQRCRADAVGMLGEDRSGEMATVLEQIRREASVVRPRIAVATQEGLLVNQHLGVANRVQIWEEVPGGYAQIAERPCPSPGTGEGRWQELSDMLYDCRALLVQASGEAPRKILETGGVAVLEMEGLIEDALQAVYAGGDLSRLKARRNGMGSNCGCGKVREPGTGCG